MDVVLSVLPLAIILSIGIFVQSTAGFAAGLLIVPSLLWFGYTIPAAQCSLLVATIPQNIWGVWTLRESITTRQVIWPGLGRMLFFPLGVWVLSEMESLPVETIRQIVGAFVLVATLAIMIVRPKPKARLNPIWAFLAFPVSGFCQGVVGMGGPVMVFWVQAHDWGTKESRAFLFSMYLISILPALIVLYHFFGNQIVRDGLVAAAMIPLLLLVTFCGLSFGTRLGRERLRRISLALLLLIGLVSLASPLFQR